VSTSGGDSLAQAAFRVRQHGAYVFSGDAREPVEEIVDSGSCAATIRSAARVASEVNVTRRIHIVVTRVAAKESGQAWSQHHGLYGRPGRRAGRPPHERPAQAAGVWS
jgi:hypothetical protein